MVKESDTQKQFDSPYTPSGLNSWQVMWHLIANGWDWSKTMGGSLRGAIHEGDLKHATRYFENHPLEVLSKLIRAASEQPSLA